ncbi:uncharacterized protein VTP21DRAFT_7053 [Calcarisporiella thermophila]|uniref:uncharacterized protein n=1 Tax=Calcarisporiella thermophila TaxID=911321 RepID=UPI0037438EAD
MLVKSILGNCLVAIFISAALAIPAQQAEEEANMAPLIVPTSEKKSLIQDSYIVVLHPDKVDKVEIKDQAIKSGIKHIYELQDFKGYAGKFDAEVLKKIRKDPRVKYVEHDFEFSGGEILTQNNAPWGLARVSHRPKLNDTTNSKYIYDSRCGEGVTAYVIDSGIYTSHPEFEGRARWGATFAPDGDKDLNGHGTHVAGTIGSKTYGVAKKVKLVAVKVLNARNTGSNSNIIAGVNWAAKDQKNNKKYSSVANMSIQGGKSPALNDAVNNAVREGLAMIVCSGNYNNNACNYSPASAVNGTCVAATDINDKKASFSNYGPCVHIHGPGVDILSTWNNGGTRKSSGCSMATPHVTGVAACFLTQKPIDPLALRSLLKEVATRLPNPDFPPNTTNLMVFNNVTAAALAV